MITVDSIGGGGSEEKNYYVILEQPLIIKPVLPVLVLSRAKSSVPRHSDISMQKKYLTSGRNILFHGHII